MADPSPRMNVKPSASTAHTLKHHRLFLSSQDVFFPFGAFHCVWLVRVGTRDTRLAVRFISNHNQPVCSRSRIQKPLLKCIAACYNLLSQVTIRTPNAANATSVHGATVFSSSMTEVDSHVPMEAYYGRE
ncbi:hypothetical protein EVG20_g9679 [Dentipellis fragilis]|uniref:Uncharacterized protein n=1 Tax=Dentipellis fragilis TaxID=205917 RepID=A0A4Y9Y0X0_9AGAM|nr:hypothetical protein EVG20_g9679 [Dentipellis fragilis]